MENISICQLITKPIIDFFNYLKMSKRVCQVTKELSASEWTHTNIQTQQTHTLNIYKLKKTAQTYEILVALTEKNTTWENIMT